MTSKHVPLPVSLRHLLLLTARWPTGPWTIGDPGVGRPCCRLGGFIYKKSVTNAWCEPPPEEVYILLSLLLLLLLLFLFLLLSLLLYIYIYYDYKIKRYNKIAIYNKITDNTNRTIRKCQQQILEVKKSMINLNAVHVAGFRMPRETNCLKHCKRQTNM